MQRTWIFLPTTTQWDSYEFNSLFTDGENGNTERLGKLPKDTEGIWDRNPGREIAESTRLITMAHVRTLKVVKYWGNEKITSIGITGKYSRRCSVLIGPSKTGNIFLHQWSWVEAYHLRSFLVKVCVCLGGSEICSPRQLRTWLAFNQWEPTGYLVQTRHKRQSCTKMCRPVSYAISWWFGG